MDLPVGGIESDAGFLGSGAKMTEDNLTVNRGDAKSVRKIL